MNTLENISIAFGSVRDNWLRAILTLVIIAFGIMALVGILTAIDTAIFSLNDNLSYLGANTFDIDPAGRGVSGRRGGRQQKQGDPFSYQQATEFKERYDFPSDVSLSLYCTGLATIKYDNEEKLNATIITATQIACASPICLRAGQGRPRPAKAGQGWPRPFKKII